MLEKYIPDTLLNELDQIGSEFSRLEHAVMAKTHILITWLEKTKSDIATNHTAYPSEIANTILAYGRMDIYRLVGKRVGRSARTVRYWYSVHAKMDGELWQEAMHLLPFSHLVEACKYDIHADTAIRFSLQYLESKGEPCNIDTLEGYMIDHLKAKNDPAEAAMEAIEQPAMLGSMEEDPVSTSERIIINELRRVIKAALKGLDKSSPIYSLLEQVNNLLVDNRTKTD